MYIYIYSFHKYKDIKNIYLDKDFYSLPRDKQQQNFFMFFQELGKCDFFTISKN